MRIGIDVRAVGPHFPGITRALLGLLRGLHRIDHDEQLVLYHRPIDHDHLASTGVADDTRFDLVSADTGPFALAQQWRLPLAARRSGVALWHAPYYLRPFTGLPPTVVTIYDLIDPGMPRLPLHSRPRVRSILWQTVMRLSIRSAAHIITSSDATARDLQQSYRLPPESVSVVPLAPDERFRPQPVPVVAALKQKYSLPERYVAYLGSNKPHKNLRALVEAWGVVAPGLHGEAGGAPPCLVIAGREDPRFQSARKRVVELGLGRSVRFLPDVADADLPALLSGALVFVFPSLAEGFGLPPLEAMACGTPVIASDRASIPEVVGDAGLLVEPLPAALAAALRRMIDDDGLRRELSAHGLRRAAEFSWASTARATLDVYRVVAARGAGG